MEAKDMAERWRGSGKECPPMALPFDVNVYTDSGVIPAHTSVLGMGSPVLKSRLDQSNTCPRSVSIHGVPHNAVWVFLHFLYCSCYQKEEMEPFLVPLLVLSHSFVVPSLKQQCVRELEKGLLNTENVVDVFQLARLCDAPRLSLLCQRQIVKIFESVSASVGWKVMKQSNPSLAKELVQSVKNAELRKKERKKLEENRAYLQLREAMEALVHICSDGCRTIGPVDKVLKDCSAPCSFPACKGLESLIRHFAKCKNRVLGGCRQCKRMWQLLELHSRLCTQMDSCKVPLCRHFREKVQRQKKKDEAMWKMLASRVLEAKSVSDKPLLSHKLVIKFKCDKILR